jgi:hypothetical protein
MPRQLSLLESARLVQPGISDTRHIELIASEILQELAEEPPVSLEVVASYCGIRRIQRAELPMSGCLAPSAGEVVMILNESDSPRRQRFTGFHEVGHAFQPGYTTRTQYRCAPSYSSVPRQINPEALSDTAAASLLLPQAFFTPDVTESAFALSSIMELSERYDASIEATAYRFQRFWPEPMMTLILEPGLRKAEKTAAGVVPRLRVVSTYATGNWPYVPKNKSASDDGALVRALHGDPIDERVDLEELGISFEPDVEISARTLPYWRGQEKRERVIAILRQPQSASGLAALRTA